MNLFIKGSFFILIAMLAFTACFLSACTSSDEFVPPTTPDSTQETPTVQPSPSGGNYVEVVYFHRTKRCYSCRYAEDAVTYTINTYFANELASGKLVYKVLNVQDSANAAIIDKYGAYTSSLFINDVIDGNDDIQQVIEIWYYLGDDEKCVELVKSEIEKHLESV